MIITNRVTIKRSDKSENNMENMHTQNAKRDMALEIRLQIPWGTALAGSSYQRTWLQWQTLASSSLGLASLTSDLHPMKMEHMRRRLTHCHMLRAILALS